MPLMCFRRANTWGASNTDVVFEKKGIVTGRRTVSPRSSIRTCMPYGIRYRGRILRCGRYGEGMLRLWESTSTLSRYIDTSNSIRDALATKLIKLAFRIPARRLPINNQFLRPIAIRFISLSMPRYTADEYVIERIRVDPRVPPIFASILSWFAFFRLLHFFNQWLDL